MPFLSGALAGVRSHLIGIGTGAECRERSRRHTISSVMVSESSLGTGLEPVLTQRTEYDNTGCAGSTAVQGSAYSTKRKRRVTFSSVDFITHLPAHRTETVPPLSEAGSHSRAEEVFDQTQNCTLPSTFALSNGANDLMDKRLSHDHPSDWHWRREYPAVGSYFPLSLPEQSTDSERSYLSIDPEEDHDRRPNRSSIEPSGSHARERRHSMPSDNRRDRHDWPFPSGYDAFRRPNSASGFSAGRNHAWGGSTQGLDQTSCGTRSSSSISVDDGGTIPSGQPGFLSPADMPPYGGPYGRLGYLSYLSSHRNSKSIDSIQGIETSARHSIESFHLTTSPNTYFAPSSRYYAELPNSYNSEGPCVGYTILPLTSRFSPFHAYQSHSRPECLALLATGTASLIPSHFLPPPKGLVKGTGVFFISNAPNGKGVGMFAQRPLRTGEVILTEVPVLVIPADAPDFLQNSVSVWDPSTIKADIYEKMIKLLSSAVRKELMHLAWGGDHSGDADAYETLMRINPLAVSLPLSSPPGCLGINETLPSSIHRGVFLKTSRCNHSCGPNAEWTFDPPSLTLSLTCLRPVGVGDEITIAYVSPYLPFFHRRANLKNLFGFDCSCDWCFRILPQSQVNIQQGLIEASDSIRKFLTTFWDSFPSFKTWTKNPSSYPDGLLISAHKFALKMIRREGLEVLSSLQHSQWYHTCDQHPPPFPVLVPDITRHTEGIAFCYGVLSDVDNFQKWVARALAVRLHYSGTGSPEVVGLEVLEKWLGNPETFPAWGLRWCPDTV